MEVSPNIIVYRNTIKDYLYSGGPRAPSPFQTQFTMYIILKGKRKKLFLAHFTHLELYNFFTYIPELNLPVLKHPFTLLFKYRSVYMSNLIINNLLMDSIYSLVA